MCNKSFINSLHYKSKRQSGWYLARPRLYAVRRDSEQRSRRRAAGVKCVRVAQLVFALHRALVLFLDPFGAPCFFSHFSCFSNLAHSGAVIAGRHGDDGSINSGARNHRNMGERTATTTTNLLITMAIRRS